jgi:hypothetical protein
MDLDKLFLKKTTQLEAFELVGNDYEIDASTAKRMYAQYRKYKDFEDEAEAMRYEEMQRCREITDTNR